jgi:hypothetical protein
MEKRIFTFLISISIVSTMALAQDTLRHFNPSSVTPVVEEYLSDQGYLTGHNDYADEEFAEKYEITGSGDVIGVIAIHEGEEGTSSMNASYKIYSVANSGLPGTALASKSIPNNSIPVDGTPSVVMFSNAVPVADEFFVSFNLGDYAHNNPGTKKIALTHSPDGTRPSSDFDVFGRNAIRWHAHGDAVWKDYRTENFEGYQPAVYFSLFPVVELLTTSTVQFDDEGSSIGSVFPNPSASGSFTVPVSTESGGQAVFQLFDLTGKLVSENRAALSAGKTDYRYSDNTLVAGTYILLIQIPEGSVSQKVIIH